MTGPVADGVQQVDTYLARLPPAPREALTRVRAALRSILPHATECIRYGMPAFTLGGTAVAGYAANRDRCAYYPMSGSVLDAAGDAVARYERTKGGLSFGNDERLPIGLLRRLVKLRLAELAAVEDGRRAEYYDDGQLKAIGPMREGRMHGHWKWFRRDGTLMRTGRFSHGDEVGTWTTWDRAGGATRVTRF